MRRRDLILGLGGAAAWPGAGRAQSGVQRRLGVLLVYGETHPDSPVIVETLKASLQRSGWIAGQNLAIDLRYGNGDAETLRRQTNAILAQKPDVVLAQGVVGATALQQATTTVPVVFMMLQDPVGAGFVTSLSRPGGNLTGFTNFDFTLVGKWLQLLKELKPGVTRALALVNPDYPARLAAYTAELARVGPGLGIAARVAGIHDAEEITQAITTFAQEPGGGLIALPDAVTGVYGQRIIDLAATYRLPAVYAYAAQVRMGGLAAYTTSVVQDVQRAAGYVDRILRGAVAGDLPVQASERFLTVINLGTAAALGLTIAPSLMASADELIE
jgi:putative ABC transport system substrate-binding protein